MQRSISLRHSSASPLRNNNSLEAQHEQQGGSPAHTVSAETAGQVLKSGPGGCQLRDIAPEQTGRRSCPLPHLNHSTVPSSGRARAGCTATLTASAGRCREVAFSAAHRSAPTRGSAAAAGRLGAGPPARPQSAAAAHTSDTSPRAHLRGKGSLVSERLAHLRPPVRRSSKRRQQHARPAAAERCDAGWQAQLREAVARIAETARERPAPRTGREAAATVSTGGSVGSSMGAARLEQRAASFQALERIENEVSTELRVLRSTLRL